MHSHARTSAKIDDNPILCIPPLLLSPEMARRSSQKKATRSLSFERWTLSPFAKRANVERSPRRLLNALGKVVAALPPDIHCALGESLCHRLRGEVDPPGLAHLRAL